MSQFVESLAFKHNNISKCWQKAVLKIFEIYRPNSYETDNLC